MEVIRFGNPILPTKMEDGRIVEGLKSKMWVERYLDAGEFKFVADVSSGAQKLMPTGSFVTHQDSTEVMVVENHEVKQVADQDDEIVITGRSAEVLLAGRVAGSNRAYPTHDGITDYYLPADTIWNQAAKMIQDHIYAPNLIDAANEIPTFYGAVEFDLADIVGTDNTPRSIKIGDLYVRLLELLALGGLGIQSMRPGPWSPLTISSPYTILLIHQGKDRRDKVVFSYDTGEIESSQYLWSVKDAKTAALVTTKWMAWLVTPGLETKYNRKVIHVDASDLDSGYAAAPIDDDLTGIMNLMVERGKMAIAEHNVVALQRAELSKNAKSATYRKDFDIGDIITVRGEYNATSAMRVTEYVEIEDETGVQAYPTLSLL